MMKFWLLFSLLFLPCLNIKDREYSLLLKRANDNCTIYNFDHKKEYHGFKPLSKDQIKIIAQALQEYRFHFNRERDTVLICLSFNNFTVLESSTGQYYSPPLSVCAVSSFETVVLVLDSGAGHLYQKDTLSSSKIDDPLWKSIVQNDIATFLSIYNKYQSHAVSGVPDIDLRIEIEKNRIKSTTAWVYEINGVLYSQDLQLGLL